MATLDQRVEYDGTRRRIVTIVITGADDSAEQSVIDVSAIIGPDGNTGSGYCILEEASWNMNDGYDNVKLSYHDEGNDEIILAMSGDGDWSAVGWGAGSPDIEASTPSEDDYDINLDVEESGDENAASTALITLSFRKRPLDL